MPRSARCTGSGWRSSMFASRAPPSWSGTASPPCASTSSWLAPSRSAGAEAHIHVIDEDQGVSASGLFDRAGFAQLTAEVALGRVGIVLGLEVARLARNNADWYRLLDL